MISWSINTPDSKNISKSHPALAPMAFLLLTIIFIMGLTTPVYAKGVLSIPKNKSDINRNKLKSSESLSAGRINERLTIDLGSAFSSGIYYGVGENHVVEQFGTVTGYSLIDTHNIFSDLGMNSHFLDNVVMARPDYRQLQFDGIHTVWLRYVRRYLRPYARQDYQSYLEYAHGHPGLAYSRYDQMISSYRVAANLPNINYGDDYNNNNNTTVDSDRPGVLTIGRQTDYMRNGPVTLTNRLRVRIDFNELQAMVFGHNNSFMDYVPTPGMVWAGPDRREIFTRMRFSISVSINKGVLNGISIRSKSIMRVHPTKRRYDIPVTLGVRYRINTNNVLIFIRLFNIEF